MVSFLRYLPQQGYGQQWAVSFGLGAFTWFSVVCFAKILPAPLQLLTMLVPMACFSFALWILPKWQEEGRRNDLVSSLVERERSHRLMNQHNFNLAAMDIQHAQEMAELHNLYGNEPTIEVGEAVDRGSTPHTELPLADKANYLLKVQQEVLQNCGDIGWALVEYITGKGNQYCEKEGWISVEKLRSNWGRHFGLNTENLRQLLIALSNIQLGEWRDSSLKEWRLLLTLG